ILMERSPEQVVAQLGVLKAGGVYVPLSPDNPGERLEYLLGDVRPELVLTQERLSWVLPSWVSRLSVDAGWGEVSGESAEDLASVTTVDSQMVVIYTSGSTGRPKGTVLGGRGYARLLSWYRERLGLGESTRYLQLLSFSFDAAQKDILGTLTSGGCLVLGPARYPDPARVAELIDRYAITATQTTPTLLYPIVDEAAKRGYEQLRGLRGIGVIGEATQVPRIRAWFESERCRTGFLHAYGPTECSDVVTSRGPMHGREVSDRERLPVGKPLPGMRVYVLDGRDELQPLGVPGELCVGGEALAQGYLNRPGLTAERFAVDPYANGERMYRTGDVARWRWDGELEVLGRADRQVKIRGLRIELGEIETALGRHGGVRASVVTVHEDGAGERRLVAYVVGTASAGELREHLRELLPEHMVPSAFVPMERLPELSIGKVDLNALPAPDFSAGRELAAEPRTTVEESLLGVWSEVLRLDEMGVHDNFFAVGGHSLLAAQVIAQVRDLFQVDVPLQALFEAPTVAEFARRLLVDPAERERVERVAEVLVSVSRLSDEEILHESTR
ncbi:MAG TPA: non-ribosomal peptide synthetase, partial [Myxococcaceae bacterium]|nr:non-ribosomal peptide synthetase [Myxococcaceae bacterium]